MGSWSETPTASMSGWGWYVDFWTLAGQPGGNAWSGDLFGVGFAIWSTMASTPREPISRDFFYLNYAGGDIQ